MATVKDALFAVHVIRHTADCILSKLNYALIKQIYSNLEQVENSTNETYLKIKNNILKLDNMLRVNNLNTQCDFTNAHVIGSWKIINFKHIVNDMLQITNISATTFHTPLMVLAQHCGADLSKYFWCDLNNIQYLFNMDVIKNYLPLHVKQKIKSMFEDVEDITMMTVEEIFMFWQEIIDISFYIGPDDIDLMQINSQFEHKWNIKIDKTLNCINKMLQ
ncbi:hypothetical protein [Orgyia pseudotsugata single capsid nuclopolyhedrovirus]|nr:hypothetical protein [Orgyia pseudotsugata single capsid nuclopolyhedrovirus]